MGKGKKIEVGKHDQMLTVEKDGKVKQEKIKGGIPLWAIVAMVACALVVGIIGWSMLTAKPAGQAVSAVAEKPVKADKTDKAVKDVKTSKTVEKK